ncbi:phage tail tape measure protein [Subtercola sp. RTI3]|uniref:phage tail tape measure protein n=1 Tax=Subtercola sp. RTI3 TaxID=3048639 RepID=UPI002B226EFC|nr:phage tail tape measure protein [Subtercola sp. RTI3]MEA9983644.1 phage tail tape measure protein [Subtercola sp. RTI3]
MTDRTVRVTLAAQVSNYVQGMERAAQATRDTGSAAEQLAQRGDAIKELSSTAGPLLIGLGAAAAAGVGLAVSKFAEFDQAMSEVQASTHESASNMNLLRSAAIKAGADTVFSAKEAADAENELAKAGVSTADILGGALTGAMSLASAGGLGVADAAELAATAMTQFKLAGTDVPHIADLLAAGAGKAQGSVDDLGQALKQGGLVASQAGQSIEQTTGTLAAFASAGLVGSDAGTSLKTMLLALENPSTKAAGVMSQYGISVYDAQGKMLGFSGIADQLKTKLGGLTEEQRNSALATIFGSDAVRSASVLYDQGAAGIEDWTNKVNDSGFAAETARIKLDNLRGDLEFLSGSIDTALIQTGSSANETLRALVQGLTNVVDTVGNLPAPVLAAGLIFGVLLAAVGLLGGGFIALIPKIAATKLAMQELSLSGKSVAIGFGKGGGVLLAVTALISGFAGLGAQGQLTADQLAAVNVSLDNLKLKNIDDLFPKSGVSIDATSGALASLKEISGGFGDETRSGFVKWVDGASFGMSHLSDVYKTNEATFKQIGTSFGDLAKTDYSSASKQFADLVTKLGGGEDTVKRLLEVMPEYKASLVELAGAQGVAGVCCTDR